MSEDYACLRRQKPLHITKKSVTKTEQLKIMLLAAEFVRFTLNQYKSFV